MAQKLEDLINKDLLAAYDDELKKTYLTGGIVFDISAHKATGSPAAPATFASLAAALGTNGANIPQNMRKGGMTVKFIKGSAQSQSNKYVQYRLTSQTFSISEADWECIEDSVSALEEAVGTGGSVDERIAAEGARHYLKAETYTKTEVNGLVDTPHQEYVTVEHYADLPATGSADTIYRVSNWDGSADGGQGAVDATVYSEYAWDGVSDPRRYVFLCVKSQIGEVFDISVYNNNAVYADLTAALGVNGANVPESLRKGGMSIKFIQGSVQSSDNNYVQFRYMSSSTAVADFTNVANWQGVDGEPTAGSKNLVESGGVKQELVYLGADNQLINGAIDTDNNGHILPSSIYKRVVTYCFIQAPIKIETSGNIQFRRVEYTLDGNFINIVGGWTQTMEVSDTSKLYRFVFKKEDTTAIDVSEVEAVLTMYSSCKYVVQEFSGLKNEVLDHESRINVLEENKITYINEQLANIHNNATLTHSTDPEPTDGSDWAGHNISPNNGGVYESANYNISYYIGIDSNSSYKCTKDLRRLGWYDINKSWISPTIENIEANSEIVPPTGAHFCRIMYSNKTGYTPDDIRFGKYNQNIDVPYGVKHVLEDKYGRTILTEDDIANIEEEIEQLSLKKMLTVVGSSGLALGSGGQYCLTEEQKETYSVNTDLVMAKVMQMLLGYNEANICADSGNTASNTMFRCSLTAYVLKNSVTLPKNGSSISYVWNTDNIGTLMTETLSSLSTSNIGSFEGIINGEAVFVDAVNGTMALKYTHDSDFVVPAGSMVTRTPMTHALNTNNTLRKPVVGSYGLVIQIGANSEGATPEEIVAYCELLIKASGCKWFVCLPKNSFGPNSDTNGDLNAAIPLLKKKYGSHFVDHRYYMSSLQALIDQGITPTTSEAYPDLNGQNSNPLTETQIANGVKCDMQCIAEGIYPSSFWHSAYREGEPQNINSSHFNAQGLECWGKFMVKMVRQMGY